jgi:hypothetical protein
MTMRQTRDREQETGPSQNSPVPQATASLARLYCSSLVSAASAARVAVEHWMHRSGTVQMTLALR